MHVFPVVPSKDRRGACAKTEWKGARVLLLMLSFRKLWCDCAPYLKIPSLSPSVIPSISEEFCYGFTLFIRCVTSSQISRRFFFFYYFFLFAIIYFCLSEREENGVLIVKQSKTKEICWQSQLRLPNWFKYWKENKKFLFLEINETVIVIANIQIFFFFH